MLDKYSRRDFLKTTALSASALVLPTAGVKADKKNAGKKGELHLGLVTYNIAKEWDVDTIIKNCTETEYEGAELRTTHAHKVELDLTAKQRREVKKKFEDSPVKLLTLGSTYEYHSNDPAELRKNIEGAKEYTILAKDVGASGIKVRPNGLMVDKGVPEEETLKQIGVSLNEVGKFAEDYGIQVRVEVHGPGTSSVPRMKKIMDYADCDNVIACWNCNKTDLEDGGFESNYNLLKSKIKYVHMHDLSDEWYPYRRLFVLLKELGLDIYCCAEIQGSSDPIRLMKYYRALFLAYQNII